MLGTFVRSQSMPFRCAIRTLSHSTPVGLKVASWVPSPARVILLAAPGVPE